MDPSILAPKGAVHYSRIRLGNRIKNIRYDISPFLRGCFAFVKVRVKRESRSVKSKNVRVYLKRHHARNERVKNKMKKECTCKIKSSEKNCEETHDALPLIRCK